MYQYTLHVCDGKVAESAGTRLLIRRGNRGLCILAALIKSTDIIKVSAYALQRMIEEYKCNLRRSSTKSAKIRELMQMPDSLNETTAAERDHVDRLLTEMDEKRQKKQGARHPENEAQEDEQEACTSEFMFRRS